MKKIVKKKTPKAKPVKTVKKAAVKPTSAKIVAAKTVTAAKATVKTVTVKSAKSAEQPSAKSKAPTSTYFYANGKRKTSVASIRLFSNGKGAITINNRTFENYFPLFIDQDKILSPMRATNMQKMFDVSAHVRGGGIHSQAEAVRHGISKALLIYKPEFRSALKHLGFLTRDSRMKERKKYGLKRARRAPQWQKR